MANTQSKGVQCVEPKAVAANGTNGLACHVYGAAATVTAVAEATHGIGNGNLIEKDN